MNEKQFRDGDLEVEIFEEGPVVRMSWRGRSLARRPAEFLGPLLGGALETALLCHKPLQIEFQALQYMNSSTLTPVLRLLEEAKARGAAVTVQYARGVKWQATNFTALEALHARDTAIRICGV